MERAHINEILALAGECCVAFEYWVMFGRLLFPKSDSKAAQVIKGQLKARLGKIGQCLADKDESFLNCEGYSSTLNFRSEDLDSRPRST